MVYFLKQVYLYVYPEKKRYSNREIPQNIVSFLKNPLIYKINSLIISTVD